MPKSQPLEYQPAVPAFLQRLKAGHAALDGRHNVAIPRARGGTRRNDRLNMKGEEGDDDPVMLDEQGNVVSKEELDVLDGKKQTETGDEAEGDGRGLEKQADKEDVVKQTDRADQKRDEKVSSGFGGRKRKAVKVGVIDGADEVETEGGGDHATSLDDGRQLKSLKDSTSDLQSVVKQGKEDAKKEDGGNVKKGKRKKIKLSFDEPE